MSPVRFVAIALMLPLVSVIAQTQSGKVSGTLTVNGKKLQIRHVSAVTYDTPNLGRVVSVLLSDNPVDPKKFQEYTRIGPGERYVPGLVTGAWVTLHVDDKALSGFHFTVDAKDQVKLAEVLVGTRDDNFGVMDDALVFEATSKGPRLAGRIRTKDPIADLGPAKMGIDITFDAAVVPLGK